AACGGDDSNGTPGGTSPATTEGSPAGSEPAGPATSPPATSPAPATIPECTGVEPGAGPAPNPASLTTPWSGARRERIVIGSTLAPANLDITVGSGAAIPAALLYNVYETLVKIDAEGELQPLLAER